MVWSVVNRNRTRGEAYPERPGHRPTPLRRPAPAARPRRGPLDPARVVVHVHGLEVGVDIERLRARLAPARAGVAQATEGHVRLGAIGRAAGGGDAARHP